MKRILICEDDRFMANVCRDQFIAAGFAVALAHDGHAAIEELVSNPPDLVLLDLMLPEIDGVSVLRFLRSRESLRELPVIVVSNSSYFSGVVQAAWQAGATHFLNKGECSPKTLVDEALKVLGPAAAAPAPTPSVEPRPAPKISLAEPTKKKGGIHLLLADDDKLIHGVLDFFMKQAGIRVTSAYNGRQALEMALADLPDVLVLDGKMPELDGREVLLQWCQTPALAKIPVIFLTGLDDEAARSGAISGGAAEYFTKPFSPDSLVSKVLQYARR